MKSARHGRLGSLLPRCMVLVQKNVLQSYLEHPTTLCTVPASSWSYQTVLSALAVAECTPWGKTGSSVPTGFSLAAEVIRQWFLHLSPRGEEFHGSLEQTSDLCFYICREMPLVTKGKELFDTCLSCLLFRHG